ncbi:hypothetical protein TBR22_A12060 [Luteitalea sp. TBR-22]|uniref:MtrB/PioB family decaheme-associated outer membrane protein n=1 Tax=Luteitalea sp. TBR-22 TaxID=2802971 RepID=UPI001AF713B4|nr:MtrB/PioB family decaheme-associated outer membrane protein [Luteitalea sp. TBR-22]BCS32002.1 hypothetical protein TBR22_A12060 [Luteitalea sp. TBR-22]
MTTRMLAVGLFGALLCATPTSAQTPFGQPPADDAQAGPVLDPNFRSIDFGVRFTDVDGDEARLQRYRDLRTGPVVQGFRWTSENQDRLWRLEADNVGYRDQRYSGEFEQFGRFKGWFQYNQIPYFQSNVTRTPYTVESSTVVTVPDSMQTAIGTGVATLPGIVDQFANPFELRVKRDITSLGGQYQLNRATDINFSLISTGRSGNQPWGASFGMASTQEIPAPIEQRDTQIAANLEWANKTAMFRAGYDGSLFNTSTDTLTFDNPLRITNTSTATSIGRLSRWAGSSMHTLSATGSIALPARSRVIAYVGQSTMTSDANILPWTINPAITPPPQERTALEGEVDVTSLMLRFNSRPTRWMWLNANYRSYDLNNKTPVFEYTQRVAYDTTLGASVGESEPVSMDRDLLELDASLTPFRNGAFRVGFVREDVQRTFRIFDTTVEDTFRVGYDWTSNKWFTVRADWSTAERRGEGFNPEILEEVGEQPGMRHPDVANRDRDQGRVILTAMPTDSLSLNFTASAGTNDYVDTSYGLRANDFSSWGFGFDFAPSDAFNLGANYVSEDMTSLTTSRTANPAPDPGFFDPRRDWNDDIEENVETVSAYLEVPKMFSKLDFAANYDYTKADTSWNYTLVPNTVLPTPIQLNPVSNAWTQLRLDTKYWLRRNLALGVTYMFDKFDVSDWALSPTTLDRLAYSNTFMLMNYTWENYTAHTVWLKATYLW